MHKVKLSDLSDMFSDDRYVVIAGLGFDARSNVAVSNFPLDRAEKVFGIVNRGLLEHSESRISEFNELTKEKGEVIGWESNSIIEITDKAFERIGAVISDTSCKIALDVSSFSHELLVALLAVIHELGRIDGLTLLYVGAANYSVNTTDDFTWLSRGVREIRSVLGFPGAMRPSKKLHLLMLAGFEVERAAEVIARYEPASISIGLGMKDHSVSATHYEHNRRFVDRLNQFVREQDVLNAETAHLEFSCVDPLITKKMILDHLAEIGVLEERNIAICPLNTKLSTVGAVLAGIARPDIQICYAEPEEYNWSGYCAPGDEVIVVTI